jgi:hypothetical protein
MKYRFQCAECGYAYTSLWYEPNWIAKRFYLPDHKSFHYNSWLNEYPSQWKRHGAEIERERIIKLLEAERWELPDGTPAGGEVYMPLEQAIALIKGEK